MLSRQPNPFRPGFAEPPLVLVGRDEVLEAADEALTIAVHDLYTPPPLLLFGSRGVGKTVILSEVARRAGAAYGWPRLRVEVTRARSLVARLIYQAHLAHQVIEQVAHGERMRLDEAVLRAQLLGLGAELHLRRGRRQRPGTDELETAFAQLAEAASQRQTGFVLTVDELHAAETGEFGDFASLLQYATEARWPMVVVGAGLPSLREIASNSETYPSLGYLERADWHELGLLSEEETVAALQGSAAQAGRPMDDDAASLLASASGGYPFAVQVYGKHAWRASQGEERIRLPAAQAALDPSRRELDRGLYSARWERTSPREREYLQAVAHLAEGDAPVTGRAVADRLGAEPRQLASYRARLISKGTLVAHGETLEFAIPGMADYVRRRAREAGTAEASVAAGRETSRPCTSTRSDQPPRAAPTRVDWGPFKKRAPRDQAEGEGR
jgi:type II secretory pathway predicted ATPase ExeA